MNEARRPSRLNRGVMTSVLGIGALVWLSITSVLVAADPPSTRVAASVAKDAATSQSPGEQPVGSYADLYALHCATCHGDRGRGDGPAAYLLYPKPRDFTSGLYRFKSTPGDQLPTVEDVQRVVREGVGRTAMPAFDRVLDEAQIAGLAQYALSLNENVSLLTQRQPVVIPSPPLMTDAMVRQGKLVYDALGCGACHGPTGQGDGASSHTLKDSQGYPLPPADFTTGVFKAGRKNEDLYRTIVVGVPGTPMPSFAAVLQQPLAIKGVDADTDIIWAMTAYVRSLEVAREPAGQAAGARLTAYRLSDPSALCDPRHDAWSAADPTTVSVQPLWQRQYAPRSASIRAARYGDQIALLVQWTDSTFDAPGSIVDDFTDAAGLMFSLGPDPVTLTMGAPRSQVGSESTVNLWHWRADRQMNADGQMLRDVSLSDAGEPADYYVGKHGHAVRGPLTEHDPVYVPAWREGNPKSDPALLLSPVLESNAAGFGTLTLQPADGQHVMGKGVWVDGTWRVVFSRTIDPAEDRDVDLNARRPIPFALAIWDGAAGDRNGTKLVSGWHWLAVDADDPTTAKEASR